VLAHGRDDRLKTSVFRRHVELDRDLRAFAVLDVAPGRHPRAVHDQRSRIGVEQVDPQEETLGRAPRRARLIADFELRAQLARRLVQIHRWIQIHGSLHVYSQPG
jgi:hypothetical protein